jgi:hypothetical protein
MTESMHPLEFQEQLFARNADDYPIGSIVPRHFTPWIIVLSFLVSLVGAEATVELLHRRRVARDWYSRYVSFDPLMNR